MQSEGGAFLREESLPRPRVSVAGPVPLDRELILRDLLTPPLFSWTTYGADKNGPNYIEADCSPDELRWLHYTATKQGSLPHQVCVTLLSLSYYLNTIITG